MKWIFSLLLAVVLIAVGSADCGWKQNHEYNYKVATKTLKASAFDKWEGAVFRARLSIWPTSDNMLIATFDQPEYASTETSKFWEEYDGDYQDMPLGEQFRIKLKNGMVDGLYVDNELSENQVQQIKFVINMVINQLNVDTNAQEQMVTDANIYTKNEETFVGKCDTTYSIFARTPELQTQGTFFDVVKSRNYNKCKTDSQRLKSMNGVTLTEVNRIILSGPLNDCTIQSSVSTIKSSGMLKSPTKTTVTVNVTLESVRSGETSYSMPAAKNIKYVQGSLYHKYEDDIRNNQRDNENDRPVFQYEGALGTDYPDKSGENRTSACYTWFVGPDEMCRGSFGGEWTSISVSNCGFLGHESLCQRQYPGCEATVCYTAFVSDPCADEFGTGLPRHIGGFSDCSPGLYRWRCCPAK
ncbi:Vitellogenin-A1 [Pseudolycoriella hygida]|uniref:Vitellogenin-A1 n=1 Tax=Pseudolycoriella hygida TaxID=35572 RepID=A0A9Q0NAW5_9DIPT|nr:Vitellogenin-A1 [Pseudolycoriella hygida]